MSKIQKIIVGAIIIGILVMIALVIYSKSLASSSNVNNSVSCISSPSNPNCLPVPTSGDADNLNGNYGLPPCDPSRPDVACVYTPPPKPAPPEPPAQSGKIDEHLTIDNTLRDVNFCGNIYKVKQVIIDGVDVVQRIAKLVKNNDTYSSKIIEDFAKDICKTIPLNPPEELNIERIPIYAFNLPIEKIDEENKTYRINTQLFLIAVRPAINTLYIVSGYDGTHKYFAPLK